MSEKGGGEGEGPGAGGLWRLSAAVLCKGAQGLGVTSLPAGGARRGEWGGSSVQCGGGGARGLGERGEGRGAHAALPTPPRRRSAARRTWAPGRIAARFLSLKRFPEPGAGRISRVFRLRHCLHANSRLVNVFVCF